MTHEDLIFQIEQICNDAPELTGNWCINAAAECDLALSKIYQLIQEYYKEQT